MVARGRFFLRTDVANDLHRASWRPSRPRRLTLDEVAEQSAASLEQREGFESADRYSQVVTASQPPPRTFCVATRALRASPTDPEPFRVIRSARGLHQAVAEVAMSTKAEQYKANEARKNGRTKRASVPPPAPKRARSRRESSYVKEGGGSRKSSRKTTGHAKPASTFDHVEEMKRDRPSTKHDQYEARSERVKGSRENASKLPGKGRRK